MRITTGTLKGRVIPPVKGIRPTQDKVRKAIFDILGDIQGLRFLELFAGSGAVGFEAVSRGAAELVLVENAPDSLKAIRMSQEAFGLDSAVLYPFETERAIHSFHKDKRVFDIIFLDPPYHLDTAKKTLQTLGACDILAPNGLIIVQHFKNEKLPGESGELALIKEAKYADTRLSFYSKVSLKG